MVKSSYVIGRRGENIAINYLAAKNWNIVAQNYKVSYGEIDIIGQKKNLLVAFEVKFRANPLIVNYAVNSKQQKRIRDAFLYFLSENSNFSNYTFRFDSLFLSGNPINLEHIENAWSDDF